MIPQAYITAWRRRAPWALDSQVEQDLVLTRAMVEIFRSDAGGLLAMRGGTALNKLILPEAVRYSEDIDLVQLDAGPIGPILDSIRNRLDPLLGDPSYDHRERSVRLVYRFISEIEPVTPLRLKIEINTREHGAVDAIRRVPFELDNPWHSGGSLVNTYSLEELMATKLRALYQRRKGRDLFDLGLVLDALNPDPDRILSIFTKYMLREGDVPTGAVFLRNLDAKMTSNDFLADMGPLLRPGTAYDPMRACTTVRDRLIARLEGTAEHE